jgi:glycosyltransferase involved in cell wall biosynthesis
MNERKKIIFINQSAGYLTVDMVHAFYHSGLYEKVVLITGKTDDGQSIHQDIEVSFIKKYTKKTLASRTLSWIIASIQVLFLLLFKYRNYHVFLFSNPPLISFIVLFLRHPYSVLIYDLYPEWLVKSGIIRERSIINRIWSRYNNRFFGRADHVFTITGGIAKGINRYSPACKVSVIPVWCETFGKISPSQEENRFINRYHLKNKFIVMYSGNMGKGHDPETLVYLAERLKKERDIVFIFSGEGWKKQIISDLICRLNLDNCLLLPRQSRDIFPDFLAAAHIGVVSVTNGAELVCIPSKTYNLLSFGVPILGITENFSDLFHLVTENRVGKCFSCGDISGMAAYVQLIKSGQGSEYRDNALRVSKKFTGGNVFEFLNYSYSFCRK